jgi:glycosyltransferase involved in cell wall biosynthesis
MDTQANIDADISVVCTLYKKPESLLKQIEAIKNQTIKPLEILLFQDGIAKDYTIGLQDGLRTQFDGVCSSEENVGVWGRFNYARNAAKGKYVCVFDDDTIPGEQWLENCYTHMQKQEAVYGTIGIIMTEGGKYPIGGHYPKGGYYRVGWDNSYHKTVEVDFVGHSWFLKREWLSYMFDGTEKYQKLKYVAEDMTLSVQCQKHGIKTFVPRHPYNNMELWGSIPKLAKQFGSVAGSVSVNSVNMHLMNDAVKMCEADNWQPLYKHHKREILRLFKAVRHENRIIFIKRVLKKIKKIIRENASQKVKK